MEKCLSFRGIPPLGQKTASPIDTALSALYRKVEMSPDSQLEQTPPDSQLEAVSSVPRHVGGVECGEVERSGVECGAHEIGTPPTCGHASIVPPTFPDESGIPAEPLMYGYYLPHKDLNVGNRGHALSARFVWKRYFRHLQPQPLDGVAVWTFKGGHTVVRTVVRDFFTGKYVVLDRHPATGKVWAPSNIV